MMGRHALLLAVLTLAGGASDRLYASPEGGGVRLEGASGNGGRRVRLGGISVGAGYSRWSGWPGYWGPYWGPYWYPGFVPAMWGPSMMWPGWWGLYDPFWYSPWIHPALLSGFSQREGMGEVKLSMAVKTASVYLDGAYAGTVRDLKNLWLRPGAYDLEIRDLDRRSWQQRVYVLSGKTLRLQPELQ